jgi:hypothetical protein
MWEDLVNLVSTIVRMMPWSGSLSQLESIPHNPYIMKLILGGLFLCLFLLSVLPPSGSFLPLIAIQKQVTNSGQPREKEVG